MNRATEHVTPLDIISEMLITGALCWRRRMVNVCGGWTVKWCEKCRVWIAKHHPFITWLPGVTARWLLVAACAADCYLLPQSSYPHFLVETRLPSTGDSASFTSWQPLGHFVLGFVSNLHSYNISIQLKRSYVLSCCCLC